jgi:hypothetical protein
MSPQPQFFLRAGPDWPNQSISIRLESPSMAGAKTQAIPSPCGGNERSRLIERPAFGQALRFVIARLCHGSRGYRRFSRGPRLHIMGIALIANRSCDRPQTDCTGLLAVTRIGLLICPELVSTHNALPSNGCTPLVSGSCRTGGSWKRQDTTDIRWWFNRSA